MSHPTPRTHAASTKLFECQHCLEHHSSAERLSTCPDCGGPTENLSKARAE